MEVRAYSIYARFVDVSENEVVREAKEWVFWYKYERLNALESTFHAVICIFYTY